MSILHGQPPPYSEAQVLNSVVSVSASDANLQQSILNLATQDPATLPQNLPIPNEVPQTPEDAANYDTFKQNIYLHPLFPLLAMVFEKCENATHSPDQASHSFEKELQGFMKHHESLKTPILGPDTEVNELMIKAIQVLRIHLMEVEKVNDLCKDFCTRYISCLKSKLTSEQLLHVEGCDSPEPQDLSQSSQNLQTSLNSAMQVQQSSLMASSVVGGNVVLQQQQPQIVSGNTVYQMVHTPQGIVAQPIQIQGPLTPLGQPVQQVIHGSTPLSQIGVSLTSPTQQQQQQQQHLQQQGPHLQQQPADIKPVIPKMSDDDEDDKNSKQKRGILPKQATQVMKSWLFQHIVHPYPTEDEKRQIASQTNLTLLQVNNWFINARRRILQPMLEASNPDKNKTKKPCKPGNKPQQRFWPIQPNSKLPLKSESEEGEGSKSSDLSSSPKKSSTATVMAAASSSSSSAITSVAERIQQQILATDSTLASQHDGLAGYLPNGSGVVLKLGGESHLIPTSSMATPTTITLESLQALQSSGFMFAPNPTPLPFSLPLSALSPSAGAGLGLGVGPFSSLGASPMTLGALNFASAYSAPLQFASCISAAPIDLSTMSSSTALQLSSLTNGSSQNPQHIGNAGQVLMGVSLPETNGDQSLDDAEESPEAGELKIDTREVQGIHDVGEG